MERKKMKRAAKGVVKRHYVLLVTACLIAALLGVEFTGSLDFLKGGTGDTAETEGELTGVVTSAMTGDMDLYSALLNSYQERHPEQKEQTEGFAGSVLGRSRGVLASVVNSLSSGKFTATVIVGLRSITHSENAAAVLFTGGSLLLSFLVWMLIKRNYLVALRRVILEARTYEKTPFSTFRFLLQNGRWLRTAAVMLLTSVYQLLWGLTVVGGFIKRYSYLLVPYIAAENPTVKPRQAIALSRRMMKGHKWQCFLWEWTFLGWNLLGFLTLGLSNLFFTAPYKAAFFAEYYAQLRRLALNAGLEGVELLNDAYLYEKASREALDKAYADVAELKASCPADPISQDKGFRHFLAKNFGISLYSVQAETRYDEAMALRQRVSIYENTMDGRSYPVRLHPKLAREKQLRIRPLNYLRHYSPFSLILLFFLFAFVGWLWEVLLGFLQGGVFVNRGVLHGPWLPIYGTGAVIILVFLARFRKKPLLEFVLAMVLSGTVEYFTAWYLEATHGGMKWWDYTGYFLNLHGRICAEGLLTFGVAGMLVVYYLGPVLDMVLRKLKPRIAAVLCVILLAAYIGDNIYSASRPNMGPGVTDVTACVEPAPERNLPRLCDL